MQRRERAQAVHFAQALAVAVRDNDWLGVCRAVDDAVRDDLDRRLVNRVRVGRGEEREERGEDVGV